MRWQPPGLTNLAQLRGYQPRWFTSDLVAGLTVAAYLVPQVMAYAGVAGLPPATGLWATMPALVAYAILGSSRQLSIGPESSTALLSASIVGPLAAGSPERFVVLSGALALVFGVYCLLAWLVRLGFVADLLSRPVLVGYLSGVAVTMVVGQLGRITGIATSGDSVLAELRSFARNASDLRPATLAVAGVVFALSVALPRLWPRLPGPLLAVVFAIALVTLFGLDHHGVAVVGRVAGGLPRASGLPSLADVQHLLLPAVGVLVVGYTDTVLTARAFAAQGGYDISANQELLALGAANIGSGLVGGFSVSSSASRTALGAAAGSRSQAYSLVCLTVVAATLAFGRGLLLHLPQAALGALVLYAAVRLVDIAEWRRLARFRRRELVLAMATTAAVLGLNLLYGILVAVALSVIEMLSRVARPHDAVLGLVSGLAGMHDVDDYPQAEQVPGLVVYRYDSPLFFANAEDFKRRALAAVDSHRDVRWFLLNVEANVEVDITGLDALESLRETLAARGIQVALARVKQDLLTSLNAFGLADRIGRDRLFPTMPTALAAYEDWRRTEQAGHPVP